MAKVSSAADFKKNKEAVELVLPSGNTCLARKRSLDAFITQGAIPNSLMGMIQQQMDVTEGKPPDMDKELRELLSDSSKLADVVRLADAVVVSCVVEPQVCKNIADHSKRNPDNLYVDEVDMDDKMFIFSWAIGGTKDLERFREEQASVMESISAGEEPADKTE